MPRWVRRTSSPARIIGTPRDSSRIAMKFFAWRRATRVPGSRVSPSTPQFQVRLSSLPSRLSSPLASLCFAVVAHEVVQREAVVAGDEVDAVLRRAVAAYRSLLTGDPSRHLTDQSRIAAHEAPQRRHDSGRSIRPSACPGRRRRDRDRPRPTASAITRHAQRARQLDAPGERRICKWRAVRRRARTRSRGRTESRPRRALRPSIRGSAR